MIDPRLVDQYLPNAVRNPYLRLVLTIAALLATASIAVVIAAALGWVH